jgi:hypothetical protein
MAARTAAIRATAPPTLEPPGDQPFRLSAFFALRRLLRPPFSFFEEKPVDIHYQQCIIANILKQMYR